MLKIVRVYLSIVGPLGLLTAIVARLRGVTREIAVTPPGARHPVFLRVPSSDVPTYRQVFLRQDYAFATDHPLRVIVDAGANIGLAAVYFALRFPDARIVALEPEPGNYAMLARNVAPYPQVTPLRAALWNKNEAIDVVDPGVGAWGFRVQTPDGTAHVSTPAFTVDTLARDHALERIDILKVDIEGAEKEVFADTSAWIDRVRAIIIELHEYLRLGCNRSFYSGSSGFDHEWRRGENTYVTRDDVIRELS